MWQPNRRLNSLYKVAPIWVCSQKRYSQSIPKNISVENHLNRFASIQDLLSHFMLRTPQRMETWVNHKKIIRKNGTKFMSKRFHWNGSLGGFLYVRNFSFISLCLFHFWHLVSFGFILFSACHKSKSIRLSCIKFSLFQDAALPTIIMNMINV